MITYIITENALREAVEAAVEQLRDDEDCPIVGPKMIIETVLDKIKIRSAWK